MLIVDRALQARERDGCPIRVGIVGAGAMARGIVLQIATAVHGMEVVAIANRHLEGAERAFREAGVPRFHEAGLPGDVETCLARGDRVVTTDARLLCEASGIDVILEATGTVEFAAGVVLAAVQHGKDVVTMNAELQGTLGPILKVYADRAGVVLTDADGDQPGVIMNLYRFVEGIGCRPLLAGNIKGLHDRYRTPTTQAGFAGLHGISPEMATSFADGTKVSFEMAIVANATGFGVGRRGMYGPSCAHVDQAAALFPMEQMLNGGLVDYIVGAQPGPGVFIVGYQDHPVQQRYLRYYKLGDGPLYTFYTPYHLCHLEVPNTVARAVLFQDAAISPRHAPVVEVVATAKRPLRAGERLDGIGHYMTYGQCVNATEMTDLLPMGIAEGAQLTRDVPQDEVLTYADVTLPPGRLCDRLRAEQAAYFPQAVAETTGV